MELSLQRYPWIQTALAIMALLGAYLCARIANTLAATAIAPKPSLLQQSVGAAPSSAPAVNRFELNGERLSHVFDVPLPKPQAATEAPVIPAKADWQANPTKSSLHGILVGTAVAVPSRYSLCQLTNQDTNESFVYAIGDRFMGARIYEIEKDRVLIDNDGRNEYIDTGAPAAGMMNVGIAPIPAAPASASTDVKQLSDNQYVVAKATINDNLSDLSKLATQARIVPSFKNGVANGFKLFSIVPDSLYAKIGVQNGDVIRRINGYEMNSPDKALEIYSKLRDANRIEIEIERRGETLRKSYSIE
ncbi:MAG: type II secretion system protein GspC [Myxococcales bacterium]